MSHRLIVGFCRKRIVPWVPVKISQWKTNLKTNIFFIYSFVSSKSSHVYLHSDIRVLFRQRAPDEPLKTVTNGPTNPKYTSMTKRLRRSKGDSENDDSS